MISIAGALGLLIPPSIVMIVYGASVNVSVGRMFLAGVIPGLLAGFMLMTAIYVMAKANGKDGERFLPRDAKPVGAFS